MRFFNTEQPYINQADHLRPLYRLDAEIPKCKTVEFTGYKSPRCVKDFHESRISFIGNNWMYKINMDFDGSEVFEELLNLVDTQRIRTGLDPRARENDKWFVARVDVLERIVSLCHIYGVTDKLWISEIVNGGDSE